MKYIGICIKGLEDVAIKEIKEILKVEAKKILDGRLEFEAKDVKKLIEKSQSLIKVYEKWGKLKFKELDEIKNYVDLISESTIWSRLHSDWSAFTKSGTVSITTSALSSIVIPRMVQASKELNFNAYVFE